MLIFFFLAAIEGDEEKWKENISMKRAQKGSNDGDTMTNVFIKSSTTNGYVGLVDKAESVQTV